MKRRAFQIIFLDIDGVLNKQIASNFKNELPIERENVSALKLILMNVPSARIVISSAWRLFRPFHDLIDDLAYYGVPRHIIIDKTPYIENAPRSVEIRQWLKENEEICSNFVILDDRTNMRGLEGKFIRTRHFEGLTDDHALAASEILKEKRSIH